MKHILRILKINQTYGILLRKSFPLFSIFLLMTSPNLKAMEDLGDQGPNVLKRASTRERLDFAKKQLRKNPSLTMDDKIEKELWPLYERDKAFILREVPKRKNGLWIAHKVNELDAFIKTKGYEAAMSFADYSFIGYAWANILTAARLREVNSLSHITDEDYKNLGRYEALYGEGNPSYKMLLSMTKCTDSIEECFKTFNEAAQEIKERKYVKRDMDQSLMCLGTSGIVLPHISMTGVVPLLSFNEGWGFYITESEDRVSYVDFLAVGTNYGLDWDSAKDTTCLSSWGHDVGHMGGSKRIKTIETSNPMIYILPIAALRKALVSERLSKDDKNKAELAFYILFREINYTIDNVSIFIFFLEIQINSIEEDLKNGSWQNVGVFPLEIQADLNIRAAKSLGIELEGADDLEKQKSYLRALKDGYQILHKLSLSLLERKL